MPYVRTVPYHEATGDLKAMYERPCRRGAR